MTKGLKSLIGRKVLFFNIFVMEMDKQVFTLNKAGEKEKKCISS